MDATGSPRSRLMKMQRWVRWSIPLATVALAGAAPLAFAQFRQGQVQERELFEWTGSVDRVKQITMRDGQVWTNDIGRTEPRREQARMFEALPHEQGQVVVRVLGGRGDVRVIQQPSTQNGYSTVVRVQDPGSGSANYRL